MPVAGDLVQRLGRDGHHIEPGTVDTQHTGHAVGYEQRAIQVWERTARDGQRSSTGLYHDNRIGGWNLKAQSTLDQHLVDRDQTGLAAPMGDGRAARELADPPAWPVVGGEELAHALRFDRVE